MYAPGISARNFTSANVNPRRSPVIAGKAPGGQPTIPRPSSAGLGGGGPAPAPMQGLPDMAAMAGQGAGKGDRPLMARREPPSMSMPYRGGLQKREPPGMSAPYGGPMRPPIGGAMPGMPGLRSAYGGMSPQAGMKGSSFGGQFGQMGYGRGPASLRDMASMGRYGDTMLAHINPREAMMLKRAGGAGTINPGTGLREFWMNSNDDGTISGGGDIGEWSDGGGWDDDLSGGGGDTTQDATSWWERALWGLGGTLLTGNPSLGAAAARYGPEAWGRFSSWLGGLSQDQQTAAQSAVEQSLEGQQHVSRENLQQALAAGYEAGGGSDRAGNVLRSGGGGGNIANNPFWGPMFDAETAEHGWGDSRNPNWGTDPRNPANTSNPTGGNKPIDEPGRRVVKPRKTIPFKGDVRKYGQRGGEHVFFDRWF